MKGTVGVRYKGKKRGKSEVMESSFGNAKGASPYPGKVSDLDPGEEL